MGIYQRKDSPYWWMLLEATGKKTSTGVPVRAATANERKLQRESAEAIYRARMTELARKRHDLPPLEPSTITVAKFAEWYRTHVMIKHRGAEREEAALKRLLPFFGATALVDITPAMVSEYETSRAPAKPRTINREVALLKMMLKAAVPEHLKASPLAGRKMLRAVKMRKRLLSAEEETRLLAELPERDRPIFIVAIDTLLRLSNVVNLTRGEDHGTHLELVDSKTGPYEVPLSTRARAALDSVTAEGPHFFPHRRTAKKARDTRGALGRLLERACARCDPPIPFGRAVAGITWHTATRASGATRMLRAGVDARTVQDIGNWKSFEQMADYLITDAHTKREAVEKIGENVSRELRNVEQKHNARPKR